MTAIEPGVPHSRDAERAVLNCLLLDEGAGLELDFLTPSDFFVPMHRTIFRAMLRVASRGSHPDYLLLGAELDRMEPGTNWAVELAGILSHTTQVQTWRVAEYGRVILRFALQRSIIAAAGRIAALAYAGDEPEALCQAVERELLAVTDPWMKSAPTDGHHPQPIWEAYVE